MVSLLDVNILIPLVDVLHEGHAAAQQVFSGIQSYGWATCPITENGVVRIISGTRYQNPPKSVPGVMALVRSLRSLPGHTFWPDDLSLFYTTRIAPEKLRTFNQITDAYLLAIAVANDGRFVTFDRRIMANAISGGAQALQIFDNKTGLPITPPPLPK